MVKSWKILTELITDSELVFTAFIGRTTDGIMHVRRINKIKN